MACGGQPELDWPLSYRYIQTTNLIGCTTRVPICFTNLEASINYRSIVFCNIWTTIKLCWLAFKPNNLFYVCSPTQLVSKMETKTRISYHYAYLSYSVLAGLGRWNKNEYQNNKLDSKSSCKESFGGQCYNDDDGKLKKSKTQTIGSSRTLTWKKASSALSEAK